MSRKTLLLALLVAVLTTAGPASAQTPPVEVVAASASESAASASAAPAPVSVLRGWDDRRAEAWARGSLRMLATLYTTGSVAGRRDRAMLHAWTSRGLVVQGLRTQLLAVRELRHTRSTWTLLVTDRLAGGVAVGHGVRRSLPRDEATTRTIRLRRVGGTWRVACVLPKEVTP